MKSIGIIAEYNPFHNGHLYQIEKIKEEYPDYKIIVVMAGNFTQRGDVAIIDKWSRTDVALEAGADLVVELPFVFVTQSADYFSYAGITILEELGVEKVVFGSESDNIEDLVIIASAQIENDDFDSLVKVYSRLGYNYPTAISSSVYDLTGRRVSTPNDLLGISYIKTILKNNYRIEPITIKRINNYHEENLQELPSATSIRKALYEEEDVSKYIPEYEKKYLGDLHFVDDYFYLIKYKIITEEDLTIYKDIDIGLNNSLKKFINKVDNTDELIKAIKSKRYTYSRLSRILIHILCNYKKSYNFNNIEYIRILGLNKRGQEYLNSIKKEVRIPIISKISKYKSEMLEFEINTTRIYDINANDSIDLVDREFRKIIYKGE